eukprot:5331615-Pleurochrysis_carterae.AAC.2
MPSPLYPALSHLIPPSPPRYLPSSLPRYFPPSLPQAHFHLPIHHNLLEPQFPHPFLPKLSSLPFPAFLPPCPISVFCWGPLVCLQCLVRPLDRPRIAIYSVRAAKKCVSLCVSFPQCPPSRPPRSSKPRPRTLQPPKPP